MPPLHYKKECHGAGLKNPYCETKKRHGARFGSATVRDGRTAGRETLVSQGAGFQESVRSVQIISEAIKTFPA